MLVCSKGRATKPGTHGGKPLITKRKRQMKTLTVELTSHYDEKTATIRAKLYDGYTDRGYITRKALNAAKRRAELVEGDYFELPEFQNGSDLDIQVID